MSLQKFNNHSRWNEFSSNNSNSYELKIVALDTESDSVTLLKISTIDENNKECSKNGLIKFENSTYREVVLPLILDTPLSSLNAITVPLLSNFIYFL